MQGCIKFGDFMNQNQVLTVKLPERIESFMMQFIIITGNPKTFNLDHKKAKIYFIS